ncbi:MAG TPA: tRNA-(ms[2]io[6]A)-hydroxylase [Bacteroidia bacterium]|nr:tRNA-(ms[2]io[6]A)-hydroxylase [Bacteroidia bacterium]
MLGLKLPTDPRWVHLAENNIDEILTDHAWCEQKAASNAISIIVLYPEYSDMVTALIKLAQEEMDHFNQVHERILARGKTLGKERKDAYVNELYRYMKKGEGRHIAFIDRLLFAALIEARSCERFRVLSEHVKDKDLAVFYKDLMASEAGHYTLFLGFARRYAQNLDVEQRWKEWLDFEAGIITNYGKSESVHG